MNNLKLCAWSTLGNHIPQHTQLQRGLWYLAPDHIARLLAVKARCFACKFTDNSIQLAKTRTERVKQTWAPKSKRLHPLPNYSPQRNCSHCFAQSDRTPSTPSTDQLQNSRSIRFSLSPLHAALKPDNPSKKQKARAPGRLYFSLEWRHAWTDHLSDKPFSPGISSYPNVVAVKSETSVETLKNTMSNLLAGTIAIEIPTEHDDIIVLFPKRNY